MICIIALNSVDVAAEIVHPTNGLNRFAVIAVRTIGGDQPARLVLPVRWGRAAAVVGAGRWDRWDRKVRWVQLEPRVPQGQPAGMVR